MSELQEQETCLSHTMSNTAACNVTQAAAMESFSQPHSFKNVYSLVWVDGQFRPGLFRQVTSPITS